MRHLQLQLNDNTSIEIHNDWTGKERIYYNNELVSEKRSFFGHTHTFTVDELGFQVEYEVDIFMQLMIGVGFEIKRNNSTVMTNRLGATQNSEKGVWLFATIVALFIAGYGVGYGFVSGKFHLVFASLGLVALLSVVKFIISKYSKSKAES